jgi:hypothetical protein
MDRAARQVLDKMERFNKKKGQAEGEPGLQIEEVRLLREAGRAGAGRLRAGLDRGDGAEARR